MQCDWIYFVQLLWTALQPTLVFIYQSICSYSFPDCLLCFYSRSLLATLSLFIFTSFSYPALSIFDLLLVFGSCLQLSLFGYSACLRCDYIVFAVFGTFRWLLSPGSFACLFLDFACCFSLSGFCLHRHFSCSALTLSSNDVGPFSYMQMK